MIVEPDLREDGINQLVIPFVYPTGDSNCFLARGETGWSIIETGVSSQPAKEKWEGSLRTLGISFQQIKKIYVTHIHPDHAGLAGWLQQQSGAEVFVPRADLAVFALYGLPEPDQVEKLRRDMMPYGIDDETIQSLAKDLTEIKRLFEPYPEATPMDPGDTFRFGDDIYEAYAVPGHSDGHLVFLGQEHKRLFSGDALLADHVTQISDWPYSDIEDPLTENLQALRRIVGLKPGLVLPGHGDWFQGAEERLAAIENLQNRRTAKVMEKLTRAMTLSEVCREIGVKARVLQEFRVSWADTRAYLECLWRQGLIDKTTDEYIRYQPKHTA